MAMKTKKKMAMGGPSSKTCKPGMDCKGVGVPKIKSGGRKIEKARDIQKKATSSYKATEAAKPKRPKFPNEYTSQSMKKGGSVKKKK